MPVCENCKQSSADYYEQDGLFYCSRCDTQSQTMQVMTTGDEVILCTDKVSGKRIHRVSRRNLLKSKSIFSPKKTDVAVPGAWQYQTMQIILKAQVKTLIDMGVTPRLKDVVGQLWFIYLHKMGLAFCDTKSTPSTSAKSTPSTSAKSTPSTSAKSTPSTSAKSTSAKSSNNNDASDLFDEEETQLENNSGLKNELDEDSAPQSPSIISNKIFQAGSSSNSKAINDASTNKLLLPTVRVLLCLLYLGLRYVHEPVMLSDLTRLVNDNDLPVWYADGLIPQELFMHTDHMTEFKKKFCISSYLMKISFQPDGFIKMLSKLKLLLCLPRIPSPDMGVVIARYAAILNLPKEFNQYVYKLFCMHNPTLDQLVFTHDRIAVAFIIVTLRLLFVLDDDVEHRLSERAQRLRYLLPECKVFVWDEWVSSTKVCNQQTIAEGRIKDSASVRKVKNVDNFLQQYWKASRLEDYKQIDGARHQENWDMRQVRQRCFQVINRKIKVEKSNPESTTNSASKEESDPELTTKSSSEGESDPELTTKSSSEGESDPELTTKSSSEGDPNNIQSDIDHSVDIKQKASESSKASPQKKVKTVGKQHEFLAQYSELKWASRDELLNIDFADYVLKYVDGFDGFCNEHGLSEVEKYWARTGQSRLISEEGDDMMASKEDGEMYYANGNITISSEDTLSVRKKSKHGSSKSKRKHKVADRKKSKKKHQKSKHDSEVNVQVIADVNQVKSKNKSKKRKLAINKLDDQVNSIESQVKPQKKHKHKQSKGADNQVISEVSQVKSKKKHMKCKHASELDNQLSEDENLVNLKTKLKKRKEDVKLDDLMYSDASQPQAKKKRKKSKKGSDKPADQVINNVRQDKVKTKHKRKQASEEDDQEESYVSQVKVNKKHKSKKGSDKLDNRVIYDASQINNKTKAKHCSESDHLANYANQVKLKSNLKKNNPKTDEVENVADDESSNLGKAEKMQKRSQMKSTAIGGQINGLQKSRLKSSSKKKSSESKRLKKTTNTKPKGCKVSYKEMHEDEEQSVESTKKSKKKKSKHKKVLGHKLTAIKGDACKNSADIVAKTKKKRKKKADIYKLSNVDEKCAAEATYSSDAAETQLNHKYIYYPELMALRVKESRAEQLDYMHTSFSWLIQHCAPLVVEEPGLLYTTIRNVEVLLGLNRSRGFAKHVKHIRQQWGCQ